MRSNFQILPLLFIITITAHAQDDKPPSLSIGDTAPPLRVQEWLKGEPVQRFEKGTVYVLEFWATWCAPCKAAMPHLSDLARKYKDRATVIGVDIMEDKTTTVKKVKAFVDSMGHRMDYTVAVQDSNFMETDWLDASGERPKHGIPRSFIVNAEGKLAWMGHPSKLDMVLPKILNNTWDIAEALAKRNSDKRLEMLDDSLSWELKPYKDDRRLYPDGMGKPDLALVAINKIIKAEPMLKYAPHIASSTFSALLKTDLHKAYDYGRIAMVTPTYDDAPYDVIIDCVIWYSDKLKLSPDIYRLGTEACQEEIDAIPYPELVNMPKRYNRMAEWYWRANDRSKAIKAQQKAIDELKSRKNFSKEDLTAYESRLLQYKKSK